MPCSAGGAQHDHTTTACQDASNQTEHGRGTAVVVQSRADKQRFAGSSARLDSQDTRPRSNATGKTLSRPAHSAVAVSNLLNCHPCLFAAKGMTCSRLCICYMSSATELSRCQSIALAMHALTIMLLMITTQETPLFLLFCRLMSPLQLEKARKVARTRAKQKERRSSYMRSLPQLAQITHDVTSARIAVCFACNTHIHTCSMPYAICQLPLTWEAVCKTYQLLIAEFTDATQS